MCPPWGGGGGWPHLDANAEHARLLQLPPEPAVVVDHCLTWAPLSVSSRRTPEHNTSHTCLGAQSVKKPHINRLSGVSPILSSCCLWCGLWPISHVRPLPEETLAKKGLAKPRRSGSPAPHTHRFPPTTAYGTPGLSAGNSDKLLSLYHEELGTTGVSCSKSTW